MAYALGGRSNHTTTSRSASVLFGERACFSGTTPGKKLNFLDFAFNCPQNLAMLPIVLFAAFQIAVTPPGASASSTPSVQQAYVADCSGDRNTRSCTSFNEMIRGNDKHIIQVVSDDSYVCFKSEEDTFFTIAFHQPHNNSLLFPWVAYEKFTNGVSDTFQLAYGKWNQDPNGSYSFSEARAPASKDFNPTGNASITQDQVRFSYTFKNLIGSSTDYSVTLRRSTLRFSERIEWTNPKDKSHNAADSAGYCVAYQGLR
jgi:hypothetical protein